MSTENQWIGTASDTGNLLTGTALSALLGDSGPCNHESVGVAFAGASQADRAVTKVPMKDGYWAPWPPVLGRKFPPPPRQHW
jgi:hypothetical protein